MSADEVKMTRLQRGETHAPGEVAPTGGRWRRALMWMARGLLLLALTSALFVTLTPPGRALYRASLLAPALITSSQTAALVASGGDVRHTQMVASAARGSAFLDVYAPTDPVPLIPGKRAGILIIAGVGDNRQDPAVINLCLSLARSGVVVMTLTTTTLINFDLSSDDTESVVAAAQTLARWPGVDGRRIGLVGVSAGGGPISLAAVDARLQDKIAYVTLFGAYFDATHLLADIGRRALDVDGKLAPWRPQDVPIVVLADAIAHTLPQQGAARLTQAFGVGGTALGPHGAPLAPTALATLDPATQAAYHLLAGDQPGAVAANLAALPAQTRDSLRQVSPSAVATRLTAPVYLLHDRSDQFVPFTESRDFAASLQQRGQAHDFVELSIFEHVEVRSGEDVSSLAYDGTRIAAILYKMLAPDA